MSGTAGGLFDQVELGGRLADLCQDHRIGSDWLARSADLDELLQLVAGECDQRLAALEQPGNAEAAAEALERLRELVPFIVEASRLRTTEGPAPAIVVGVEALERMRRKGSGGHAALVATMQDTVDRLAELCHKVNNPLTALMGRAQILQLKKGTDPNVARAAEVIEESARRVAALIDQVARVILETRHTLNS